MNHRVNSAGLVAIVSLFLFLSGCQTGQTTPTLLRLRLTPGVTYLIDGTSEHECEGLSESRETLFTRYSLTCHHRNPDGTMSVTMTLEDFSYGSGPPDSPTDRTEYDSRNGGKLPGNMIVEAIAALRGVPLEMTLSPYGEVKEMGGAKGFVDRVIKNLGRDGLEGSKETMGESITLQSQLTSNFRPKLTMLFPPYPRDPVDVGDQWQATGTVPIHAMLTPKVDRKLTVKSRLAGLITIESAGLVRTDPREIIVLPHAKTSFDLHGEQNGTLTIDEGTGLITSSLLKDGAEGAQLVEPGTPHESKKETRVKGWIKLESRVKVESPTKEESPKPG